MVAIESVGLHALATNRKGNIAVRVRLGAEIGRMIGGNENSKRQAAGFEVPQNWPYDVLVNFLNRLNFLG